MAQGTGGRIYRRPLPFFGQLVDELAAAVRARIELDYPRNDGSTLRRHLEKVELQTGYRDPKLDSIRVPGESEYLWNWFWEIRNGVTGGFGPATLTHAELAGWILNTGHRLSLWEQKAVWAMNNECLAALHEQARREKCMRKQDLGHRHTRY